MQLPLIAVGTLTAHSIKEMVVSFSNPFIHLIEHFQPVILIFQYLKEKKQIHTTLLCITTPIHAVLL